MCTLRDGPKVHVRMQCLVTVARDGKEVRRVTGHYYLTCNSQPPTVRRNWSGGAKGRATFTNIALFIPRHAGFDCA